jgi:uncharacterized protein with HEPN domain
MSSTPRRWKFRIQHILDAIASCGAFVGAMTTEELEADARTLHAVAWKRMLQSAPLGEIGEAGHAAASPANA